MVEMELYVQTVDMSQFLYIGPFGPLGQGRLRCHLIASFVEWKLILEVLLASTCFFF